MITRETAWPEDDWLGGKINDTEVDANVWIDDDGFRRITIYPVIDGKTCTEMPIVLLGGKEQS